MDVEIIPAKDLDRYIGRGDFTIVDVRNPQAYAKRHIRGAVNISLGECALGEEHCEDEKRWRYFKRGKRYILYCDRGSLSLMTARRLSESGIHVMTVSGGMQAYRGVNVVDTKQKLP